jgi:hypothetical protein
MSWATTERTRLQVLWRIHRLLLALRYDARRHQDGDVGLRAIIDAIGALQSGGAPGLEGSLERSEWSGARWDGPAHGGEPIVDAALAMRFVEALLAGCRAAVGAPSGEVLEFADSMEYLPAALCRGDAGVLRWLDHPESSRLVRLVGATLRTSGLP